MFMRGFDHLNSMLAEMGRLGTDADRLFGSSRGLFREPHPAINLWGNDERLMLTAELPGVAKDDLEITVEGRELSLKGRYPGTAEDGETRAYYRRERERGAWERVVTLPYAVDADAIEAKLQGGILALALPRAESDKPRRISVKGE